MHLTLLIITEGIPAVGPFEKYGLPGLLIFLLIVVFWYFMQDANKKNSKREDEINKQNEAREKKIIEHNEIRERAMLQQGDELRRLVDRISTDSRETANKLDRNYNEAIDKFIKVIKEQSDQNNFTTQTLIELKDKVEEVAKKNHLSKSDFNEFKKDITDILGRIGLEYYLVSKTKGQ